MAIQNPTRVPTPSGVLLLDPLSNDDGGMLPSSANIIQRFGTLQNRPGFSLMGDILAGEKALGGFWVRDQAGNVQFYVGSTGRLYHYNNASREFEDLKTGASPALNGSTACPMTFTYWEEGDFQYALACNGVDVAVEHQIGAADYAAIATGYISRTMCTVANRVMYGNTTIGGIRFPTGLAWSAVGTRATNPALARTKLLDEGGHIMALRRGARKNAWIYRENSIWVASAKAASDAQAFDFDVAWQGPGPVGPMAVADDPGFRDIYLGNDLNIREFDGTNSRIIAPTGSLLRNRFNPAFASLVCGVFDEVMQEFVISLPLDNDTLPLHLLRFSFVTGGVFVGEWNPRLPVTMLASWQVELDTTTCDLPDVPTCELPDIPTCQLGFSPGQQSVVIGASEQIGTHQGSDDNGEAIPVTMDILMPLLPGREYEFDGVEIQAPVSCPPLTVSVLVGPTYDQCTHEIALGTIDPSITPPAYEDGPLEDTAGGPNLSTVRSDTDLRGRCVIVRVRSSAPGPVQMRRLELSQSVLKRIA